jgi:hypothetical protein
LKKRHDAPDIRAITNDRFAEPPAAGKINAHVKA